MGPDLSKSCNTHWKYKEPTRCNRDLRILCLEGLAWPWWLSKLFTRFRMDNGWNQTVRAWFNFLSDEGLLYLIICFWKWALCWLLPMQHIYVTERWWWLSAFLGLIKLFCIAVYVSAASNEICIWFKICEHVYISEGEGGQLNVSVYRKTEIL